MFGLRGCCCGAARGQVVPVLIASGNHSGMKVLRGLFVGIEIETGDNTLVSFALSGVVDRESYLCYVAFSKRLRQASAECGVAMVCGRSNTRNTDADPTIR